MENLTRKEIKIIRELLTWDRRKKTIENFFYNLILTIGLIIIVVGFYYTLVEMTDIRILYITLPSVISGLIMVWVYLSGKRRFKERTAIVSFLKSIIRKYQIKFSELTSDKF